jgi:hypothetical protein
MTTRYITPAETRAKLYKWELGNVSDDTFTGLLAILNEFALATQTGDSRQARRLFDKLKGYIGEHGFGESTGTYPATQDGATLMKAVMKAGPGYIIQGYDDIMKATDGNDFIARGVQWDRDCSDYLGMLSEMAVQTDADFASTMHQAVAELPRDIQPVFMDAEGRGSAVGGERLSRQYWHTQWLEAGRQAVRQADIRKDIEASEGRGFNAVVKSYMARTGCDWETAAHRIAHEMPELFMADYMAA